MQTFTNIEKTREKMRRDALEGELIGLEEAAERAREAGMIALERGRESLAAAEFELAEVYEGLRARKTAELEAMR